VEANWSRKTLNWGIGRDAKTSIKRQMHTAIAADLSRKAALPEANTPLTVAISASSASLRARIEALARRSGARVRVERDHYEVLLIALDSSTPLPASPQALSLLVPSASSACVIWAGKVPPRGTVSRLLRAGVAGIVSLDISPAGFQSALRAIRAGLQVIDPAFTHEDSRSRLDATPSPEELTEREQEVLTMLAEGLSNKEISSRLNISTHTVKFHISSILGKLGATSRTEAVSIGIRSGRVAI
jgi:two-component system, NarL family, response regulator YdfI